MDIVRCNWVTVEEDQEDITHTAENGYECDDPDCICHEAEESDEPITLWPIRH